jgi:iron complex outermembrane recepter protein
MKLHPSVSGKAQPLVGRIESPRRLARRLLPSLLIAGAVLIVAVPRGLAQAAPAPAVPPSDANVVVMPKFVVTSAPVDPYNGTEATSAARTSSAVLDTPMTIDVITPGMISDINPSTLFQVAQYYAGVSPGRDTGPGGINDRMTFRGFESFSRSVDNFTDSELPYGSAADNNFDPVFLEHAELLMGPDTILSPTGTPGGTVNAFTKSPLFVQGSDISAEWGNFDGNKYTFDTTGPMGDGQHMAYRVIGEYQDAEQYMPGSVQTFATEAAFTYKFSDAAQLTVKYFGTQQRYGGTACLGDLDGEEIYTPNTVGGATISNTPQPGFTYDGWNGGASWSYRTMRDNKLEAELTSAIGEHINMRLAGDLYYDATNNQMAFPSPAINETFNQQTGQVIAVSSINPTSLPVLSYIEHSTTRQIQFQQDFAGDFNEGWIKVDPELGWSWQQGSIPVNYAITDKTLPNVNVESGSYSPPVPPPSAYVNDASNNPEDGWDFQTYGYLKLSFLDDRLFVTGGASRTWAEVDDYSLPYVIVPSQGIYAGAPGPVTDATFGHTGSALSPSVDPWHNTYMYGILGKVLPNVSLYYDHSTNAQIAASTPEWQSGVEDEFGVKSSFFSNRLSISADHFQITENNVSFTNPLYNTGQSTVPLLYSNLASHGYELNVAGGITPNLSVVASYTEQKLRDPYGRRRRNIPDNMANLLLDYHWTTGILRNADVFAGVNHIGDVAGETESGFTTLGVAEQPGFYVPEYTVGNVGASYHWSRYKVSLNINNVTDEKFWWQAQSRTSLVPYPGTQFLVTVSMHL